MPAPHGNTNSSRANRMWADTIRRAVIQNDGQKLRQIAERLVALAIEGDMQAIKEVGDRLDGRALAESRVEIAREESLTEEHARLVAESYLEALRRRADSSSGESHRLHNGDAPGLPTRSPAPSDS